MLRTAFRLTFTTTAIAAGMLTTGSTGAWALTSPAILPNTNINVLGGAHIEIEDVLEDLAEDVLEDAQVHR